jgi:hypothetical protein
MSLLPQPGGLEDFGSLLEHPKARDLPVLDREYFRIGAIQGQQRPLEIPFGRAVGYRLPPQMPTATITQTWDGCQVTAKYAWSDFKGPNGSVAAEIRLYQNGALEGGTGATFIPADPSGGDMATTFGTDSSAASNQFAVDGRLVRLSNGRTVRGSLQTSSVETQPCFAD